jgi:hypothetical protein
MTEPYEQPFEHGVDESDARDKYDAQGTPLTASNQAAKARGAAVAGQAGEALEGYRPRGEEPDVLSHDEFPGEAS